MSGITTEGFTKSPVHPTCGIVDYTDTSLSADNTAGTAWIAVAGGYELTPAAALDSEAFNTYPVKIAPDNSNKYVTLGAGNWEFQVEFLFRETAGAVAEIGIALADDTPIGSGGPNIYFNYDGRGTSHLSASHNFCGSNSGVLNLPSATNLRLVIIKRSTTGTITPYRIKLVLQRLSDYTAD